MMLRLNSFSTEAMALNARADANQFWPDIHFYDRAAASLGSLLKIDSCVRFCPVDERRYLCTNYWLDQQILAFFNQYPKGLGIECGAGLSTRFHRLSEQHEWPQFSWIDMDTSENIALKSLAMPVIDNYQFIADDCSIDQLMRSAECSEYLPVVIVVDGLTRNIKMKWLRSLVLRLQARNCSSAPIALIGVTKQARWWNEIFLKMLGHSAVASLRAMSNELGGDLHSLKYFGKSMQCKKEVLVGFSVCF